MKTGISTRLALLTLFAALTACERGFDVSTGLGDPNSGNGAGGLPTGAVPAVEPDTDRVADDDVSIVNPAGPGPGNGGVSGGGGSPPSASGGAGPTDVSAPTTVSNPALPSDVKAGVCPGSLNPGLFQLGGHALRVSGSANLNVNMMLGPNAAGRLSGSVLLQSLVKDPTASWLTQGSVIVSKTRTVDTSGQAQAGLAASDSAAALAPTHASLDLAPSTDSNALRLVGNGGLSVIQVANVDLQGSNSLTLVGGANETIVFNVSGRLRVGGSFVLNLEGGLKPGNVLFNVIGDGQDVLITGSSILRGTILAPRRSVSIEGSSSLQGAIVAGGDISLLGSAGALKQATLCDTK